MDPFTTNLITNIAASYFANFSYPVVQGFFQKALQLKPALEQGLKQAKTTQDIEKVFNEATGVILANAGNGGIEINSTFMEAIRGIKFDHQNGTVTIQGSTIEAPVLQTGGSGAGNTHIGGGTSLKSAGTRIDVGDGASIHMTGNAKIIQN
jgi:hypothetical protein